MLLSLAAVCVLVLSADAPAAPAGKTSSELRLMRNEVFARHGYIFKSALLTRHFKQYDWYQPTKSNVDAELTAEEKASIEQLAKAEKAAAAAELAALPGHFQDFWVKFRAAVGTSGVSTDKLAALAANPLEHNLEKGDTKTIGRYELFKAVRWLMPENAIELIKQSVPSCEAASFSCRLGTPPLNDGDRVGRTYVFMLDSSIGKWEWTGVYVNAD